MYKNNIRKYRLLKDMSQQQLGDLTGFTKSVISKLEAGKVTMTQHHMELFAPILGCHPADLLPEVDRSFAPQPPAMTSLSEHAAPIDIKIQSIEKLALLLKKNLINEKEFQQEKSKILNSK